MHTLIEILRIRIEIIIKQKNRKEINQHDLNDWNVEVYMSLVEQWYYIHLIHHRLNKEKIIGLNEIKYLFRFERFLF